ncbi:hypothetical protein PHLCEN_2v12078 [Hermanssonia centrifuga]|uniref:Carboxypeptidase n=1 Tax=Hermanssonia centrifuga TaxID=98765 RepID=A0A2R6NIG4_9APHY|nr:hypothetical protein PHLCEN_2v12078 [Hermanssonia centrifuga]
MLWLNGGPGASTIASGLLFENGPCSVSPDNKTVRNDHSWNEKMNIIYLDEPIGTGYSYATDGSKVTTLTNLAVDVYAFLQVFMHRFPQYASMPFHLAAESWGGHFGPNIAHYIFERNQELVYAPRTGILKINLASVILANGLTEPASQFESIHPYICGAAPYHPLDPDGAVCKTLKVNTQAYIKIALGVDPSYNYAMVNSEVNQAFYLEGQAMLDSAALLPALVNHGIRLMAYAGNTDGMCNYMGVELWMSRLEHRFHDEFARTPSLRWRTKRAGTYVGEVRSAGPGAGNVTFVQIYDAG